jgi:diguanylate cyclase (GGDEF)-like protein
MSKPDKPTTPALRSTDPPGPDATVQLSRVKLVVRSDERFPVVRVNAGPDMLAYVVLDDDGEVQVGRGDGADLVLHDASVSRAHAAFRLVGEDRCEVRDLGSTNGVSIGDQLVERAVLESGVSVLVGSVSLRFDVLSMAEYRHLRTVNRKLRLANHRDPLTNLHMRSFLEDKLPPLLAGCERRGAPFSAAFIDLDHFKAVNDTHGHAVGDAVLQQAARLGLHSCRETDLLLRYGGEELLLLMPDTGIEGAQATAERFRVALRAHPWSETAPGLVVTASFGVALRATGEPVEALFERADQAMYQAKAAGRDRVVVA